MGYVIRCAAREAVFIEHADAPEQSTSDGTHIFVGKKLRKLVPPSQQQLELLRALYARENLTHEMVDYDAAEDDFLWSMNSGDYKRPLL